MLSPELLAAIEVGAWVLTPNRRSAHRLRLLYANHALAQGRKAWATPFIQSFSTGVAQCWQLQRASTERLLSTEQSRLAWTRMIAASNWSERLLSPKAAAENAFRSWERLHQWRIARQDLAEHAHTDEAQALLEWADRFGKTCQEHAWLPVALLPARLLELPWPDSAPRRVVVAGQIDLLPAQQALLRHWAKQGVHCEMLAANVETVACSVRSCDSPDAELLAAAHWAREQLTAGRRAVAVAVPQLDVRAAQVARVFGDLFAQGTRTLADDPAPGFAMANYRRLTEFPLVRAALDMLHVAAGRANGASVGTVLRSPFLMAGMTNAQEASLRALADARLRSQARELYDLPSFIRLAESADCLALAESLRAVHALQLAAPARAPASATAEQFIAIWRTAGWPGQHPLDSHEQQAAARLQTCLGEFGALDEMLGPLGFAAAAREFEQLCRTTRFEPRSLPTAVTVLDTQAIDGLQFDALWVLGMDEAHWPPPVSSDAFIPLTLQTRVRMPFATAALTYEYARRRFTQLQSAAPTVVFSWPRQDGDVQNLPSPWLQECGAVSQAHAPDAERYAARIFAARPELIASVETYAPPFAGRARGGARIFELQSQCPFHAFAELRLDARPLEELVTSVDARERGTLVHAALADLWQELRDSRGLAATSVEQLTVAIRTALHRRMAMLLDGASPQRMRLLQIEIELAASRILQLLQLDRQRAAFKVVGRPETAEQLTLGKLSFELRLDRTDELLAEPYRGARVIVDYKTGHNVGTQSWLRERPEQPQLPLYAATHPESLGAVAFATVSAKSVSYQGLARQDGVLPGIKAFNDKYLPAPHREWEGLQAYWHSVVLKLADQFASGVANVDPLPTACRYCHLRALCRVDEQQGLSVDDPETVL
jgi:ATP-dependent helicase/nuclease subunit B